MDDLMERRQEDLDKLTEAMAAGYAIAMSDQARAAWLARHPAPVANDPQAAALQAARIARLRSYDWRGPNPIKGKAN